MPPMQPRFRRVRPVRPQQVPQVPQANSVASTRAPQSFEEFEQDYRTRTGDLVYQNARTVYDRQQSNTGTQITPNPGDQPQEPVRPQAPAGNVPYTPSPPGQNPDTPGPPPVTGTVPTGPETGAPTNVPGTGTLQPPSDPQGQIPITPRQPLPAIDQGPPDFANDLTGNVYGVASGPDFGRYEQQFRDQTGNLAYADAADAYSRGVDPRLMGAQGRTDAAGRRLAAGASYSDRAGANADRYRAILGDGQVDFRAGPNTGDFERLDPSVRFRSIDTDLDTGPDVVGMDPGKYAVEQDAALAGLAGPSRTELAKQALADFEAQGERTRDQRFRKVGQTAAKFGRMGLGDVNAELGSIEGDYQRDLLEKRNELARSVAEGDIGDRFRRVDATSGLRRGESDIGAGIRGERRTERAWDTGIDEANIDRRLGERDTELGLSERTVGRRAGERDAASAYGERQVARSREDRDLEMALDENNQDRGFARARSAIDYGGRDASQDIGNEYDQLDALGSLEDRVFSEGRSGRDEMRTERGYQQGATQQSLDNRIRERQIQEAIRSNDITRAIALLQAGGRGPDLEQILNR